MFKVARSFNPFHSNATYKSAKPGLTSRNVHNAQSSCIITFARIIFPLSVPRAQCREITPEEGLELRGIYFFQGLPGNCGCKISSVCDAAVAMPSKLHQRRLQTATAELQEVRQRKTSAAKPILQSSCSEND